ncbi:MAG: efflux RND transporter permease subunit, partial [Planctomycetes bacterium]|nr:efflux RND transporter permease subunit [Planctomycetota bacterium]
MSWWMPAGWKPTACPSAPCATPCGVRTWNSPAAMSPAPSTRPCCAPWVDCANPGISRISWSRCGTRAPCGSPIWRASRTAPRRCAPLARLDGEPCVTLEVRRQSGANTVEVIDGVKQRLERLRADLPADLRVVVI